MTSDTTSNLNDFVFNKNTATTTTDDASQSKLNTKHIYVTPFNLSVAESNILHHIESFNTVKNHMSDIACKKLVSEKENKKKKQITFVSFKLSFPESCFEILSKSSSWPQGVTATEFVDRSNVSKPFSKRNLPKQRPKQANNSKQTNFNRSNNSNSNFRRISPQILRQRKSNQTQMNISAPLLHPLLYNQMYQANQMFQASQTYQRNHFN